MESYCWTIHRDPLCDGTHISVFSSEQIAVAPLKVCHQCCFAVKKSTIIYAFHALTGPKKTIHATWVGHHFTSHILIAWKAASGDTRVWNWIKIGHNFCISNCLFMLCWRREHDDPVVPGARIPGFWPFILRSEVRPGWQFPPPLQPSPSPGIATAS